jgi:hypothetical protein|tara:strand:+ start:561 stop:1283 length:723 start_codon:yes stop_codon:yes gene_type:complete
MTGTEIVDMLGLRLEDPSESNFTSATKIKAINIAQRTVVNLIDNAYLTELQVIDEHPTLHATNGYTENNLVGGKVLFTGSGSGKLNIDPIRGGVIAVKVFKRTGSAGSFTESSLGFANMIEPQDAKRLENSYLAGSDSNPVAYVFQDAVYVEPTGIEGAIDVWFIKNPTEYASNTLSAECELNVALQESIIDFAESQLWKMDNKPDRAGNAYTNAINLIKALNDRYQIEKPKGIGTQGRA